MNILLEKTEKWKIFKMKINKIENEIEILNEDVNFLQHKKEILIKRNILINRKEDLIEDLEELEPDFFKRITNFLK